MLLIFDLDDTLIETTTFLTQKKLMKALKAMVNAGLVIHDSERAQEMLCRMNLAALSTRDLLEEFVELLGAAEEFVAIGMREIVKVDLDQYEINSSNEVIEILEQLRNDYTLCLVTRGDEKMQREKLHYFGLDTEPSLFSEVIVTPFFDKGRHYEDLRKKFGFSPHEVVVVGDRIESDLAPAKQMGAVTIHMKKGRGANSMPNKEIVDYTIYELKELVLVLELQVKPLEMV